jgi:hypothetical protein
MATSTKKAAAKEAPAPITSTPVAVQPVERFVPDPDQEMWVKLEAEREAKRLDPAANPFVRAAQQGIMFFNIAQKNDQFIGVGPLKQEDYPGVDLSTVRTVPLNTSEVLQAGRKVVLPSGDTMILPAGITSPEQIVHPETGERLMVEERAKK